MPRACDGRALLGGLRAAVANLEAHVDEINALNVYPVPDGDTGSNMVATVRAALAEAERVTDPTLPGIAGAIAFGALMGARGNSGVITSQIFRGMAEGLDGKRRFNGLDVAQAFMNGNRAAYRAVAKPVEGTILTVIREASEAAVGAAESANDVETVLTATVAAAETALAKTPSLLPILREAGVVDAGGAGLARLLEGALGHFIGTAIADGPRHAGAAGPRPTIPDADDDGFGYETMYLVEAWPSASLDIDAVRTALETMGDSVLVAGDARALKIHVHSDRPDAVIAYGLGLGSLSRISVENLDAQARDVRERRAQAFAANGAPTARDAGADSAAAAATAVPTRPPRSAETRTGGSSKDGAPTTSSPEVPAIGVVAVASGDGLAAIFRSIGSSRIVSGGQGANPSTGDLLQAVADVAADHVLLLPNNPNVILAARQVAEMSRGAVTVIPTRNAAEGLAAMLTLDPSASAADNAEAMTRAARGIQSLQVTHAVRDARFRDRSVRKGEVIVLDPDDGIVAADTDEGNAIVAGIDTLRPGYELLTLYYGHGTDLASAEALGRRIGEDRPDIEVEIVRGGQPHYRYLIAAE